MKKLFALVSLCAFIFSACDNSEDNTTPTPTPSVPNFKLVVTSPSNGILEFPAEGGNGEITFTLEELETRSDAPAVAITATSPESWITDITVMEQKITFNVAANNGDERSAYIYIKYLSKSAIIVANQAGFVLPDVTFDATHLGGSYYGKYTLDGGGFSGFNYFIILGDMQPLHYESKQSLATEYRFDIYSDVSSAFNATHRIPVGTYTIDHSSSGRAGSIDGKKTCSYILLGESNNSIPYKNATVVVTEDSIIADVTLFDGSWHHIEYHGNCIMEDYIKNTYADVYPVSQYTEDITFNVTSGNVNLRYRGDFYGTGCDVWFVDMIESKSPYNGIYLIFDLIVPKSAGGFENLDGIVGEYTLFERNPESYEYTIPTGRLRDDSLQMHAWYLYCNSSQVDMSMAAPFTSGTVKVTKEGNTITFDINGTDDNGNKIIGTFSGILSDIYDQTK